MKIYEGRTDGLVLLQESGEVLVAELTSLKVVAVIKSELKVENKFLEF